jgi:hypothetical protein
MDFRPQLYITFSLNIQTTNMNVGDMSKDQEVEHKGRREDTFYTLLPLITCLHASAYGTLSHSNHEPTESNCHTREMKVKIWGNANLTKNTELWAEGRELAGPI